MVESTKVAIAPDELHVARLVCVKLAGMMQGTISCGLPSLVTGVPPDPQAFFERNFEVMNGFGQVLHWAVRPPGHQEFQRLREQSRQVLDALAKLRSDLFATFQVAADASLSLQSARDSARAFFTALREYGSSIDVDDSRLLQNERVVLEMFDGVDQMLMNRVAQ